MLTYVTQAQGYNFIFEYSQGVSASVHDVQLSQNTCSISSKPSYIHAAAHSMPSAVTRDSAHLSSGMQEQTSHDIPYMIKAKTTCQEAVLDRLLQSL